jgi:hypothetical protein
MTRVALTSVVLWLVTSGTAIAQVKVTLSAPRYKAQEQILATVENNNTGPITMCIEVGQTSPKSSGIEPTPTPFSVEQNNGGKWAALLIGPDVGSSRHAEGVDAGKSLVFPFRLGEKGKMRLRLEYWLGSRTDLDCSARAKGTKQVTSAIFSVE